MLNIDRNSDQNLINMLLDHQVLKNEDLEKIDKLSSELGKSKIETLFDLKITSEMNVLKLLSSNFSLPIVDLKSYKLNDELKQIVPINYIKDNFLVPFEIDGKVIKIAISDGSKLTLMKNLKTITQMDPELYAASVSDISNFIKNLEPGEKIKKKKSNGVSNLEDIDLEENKKEIEEITAIENESEVIKFANNIIGEAILKGVSDIHIEPYKKTSRVRFRLDGMLQNMDQYESFLHENYNAVVTRIKIVSKLDIAERRIPQDGAISFKLKKENITKEVDLRVSILPTNNNERIVMRILNKDAGEKKLDELGFEDEDYDKLRKAISSPQGMILVTGPTGSGKTTTLYSILKDINKPELNILTAEDPVEYEMDGIGQVQVRDDIGYTFATALRSFLRQDPEVILVGEIRDKDTVDIALKAALTGHLVFSTIHTNDAPSTITRLQNMGTPNYLIAAALSLVMAQRLARKNCPDCKEIDESLNPKLLSSIGLTPEQAARAKVYKGKGCENCNGTGYKGRMGIYEILEITKELKQAVLNNAGQEELVTLAKKQGFRTMQDMGKEMLLASDLSFSEYERVLTV
jgi:type IV pilus assembly protein PilB